MNLFAELRRRHLIQVSIMYVVVAWLVIQVGDVLLNNVDAPVWVMKTLMVLLGLGFPVTMLMAWASRPGRKSALQATPTAAPEAAPAPAPAPTPTPRIPASEHSIAVLPFVDMSPGRDQEYFADGLSEELLNLLVKVPQLHVPARTSSFAFKGKNIDIATIAGKLNVAHVLEGSVRKAGERLRITAQLIKAADGYHLWSETYDRTLEDIFAVQDDIAAEVVTALKLKLLGASVPTAQETRPEAFTRYLEARHLFIEGTPERLKRALDLAREVVALDPKYAPAWALLGNVYGRLAGDGLMPSYAEGYGKAREAVETALRLDPTLAEAHAILGYIAANYDWDFAGALHHAERALEIEPGDSEGLVLASRLARYQGDLPRAIALAREAVAHDPVSPRPYVQLAKECYYAGQYDEALAQAHRILALNPGRAGIHTLCAEVWLAKGDAKAALTAMHQEKAEGWRLFGTARVQLALGNRGAADAALTEMESAHAADLAYQIAELHAERGAVDTAFEWLERAFRARDPGVTDARVSLLLRALHGDPRWLPFLAKIGLGTPDASR